MANIILIVLNFSIPILLFMGLGALLYSPGKKLGQEPYWQYCIPIYNFMLICRHARISQWHGVALFTPPLTLLVLLGIEVVNRLGPFVDIDPVRDFMFKLFALGWAITSFEIFYIFARLAQRFGKNFWLYGVGFYILFPFSFWILGKSQVRQVESDFKTDSRD